ncbi:avidin-like [Protobothrops mucrosquamatus]|uniref:avidin-like n=1 Tax=Protobothrops mucrosquamatus TaxID=103944 RepID=UPI000775CA7C|nr:avidin-like [Protobothrops mucrosquamatus]
MAIGLAALGLLAFLLGCSGTFAEPQNSERPVKCSLTGIWMNDHGNTIEINSVSDTGVLSGVFFLYSTKHIYPSSLQGIQHQWTQPTFGLIVSGELDGHTFVFAGQCLVDENGKEQLRTTWVVRSEVEFPEDVWGATRLRTSIFYRIK